MQFISTRGASPVSAAEAIVRGICPSGGLYVPEYFPTLDVSSLRQYAWEYPKLAARVMAPYLGWDESTLLGFARFAYSDAFDTREIARLHTRSDTQSVLELFHGPTLAFKDMALQMLPYLMRHSLELTGEDKKVYILVATSGDTGKAALEGFCNVRDTAVQVFYPHGGVSRAQWLQMATQEGDNVFVCGVEGNFDDAQTAVKRIFTDDRLLKAVQEKGYRLSSANSINFGRLLPQIVYYYSAYVRLLDKGIIHEGEKIDFCVPTGNFGNILAGYYAMRMGLPIRKLVCASNRNNVLTDFFHKGTYTANRPFYKSMSCSIDILISSNLERLLFEAAGRDARMLEGWMQALTNEGGYDVGERIAARLGETFYADCCGEEDTLKTIRRHFELDGYLMDPHTAVAQTILDRRGDTGAHTVLLATAHPFKFASDVLAAFREDGLAFAGDDDFANAQRLSAHTSSAVPEAIASLQRKPVLHTHVCALPQIPERALSVLV